VKRELKIFGPKEKELEREWIKMHSENFIKFAQHQISDQC
jgi:hypothetical protein